MINKFILVFILSNYLSGALLRDDTLNIVIDTNYNIIWQDDGIHTTTNWENAILLNSLALSKCNGLNLAGFTDWRLPNINELKTIIDYTKTDNAINPIFKNIKKDTSGGKVYYLSSTTAVPATDVWYVNFWNGSILHKSKTDTNTSYIMCVRNR